MSKQALKVGDKVERSSGERPYYNGTITALEHDGAHVLWKDVRGVFSTYGQRESLKDLCLVGHSPAWRYHNNNGTGRPLPIL